MKLRKAVFITYMYKTNNTMFALLSPGVIDVCLSAMVRELLSERKERFLCVQGNTN